MKRKTLYLAYFLIIAFKLFPCFAEIDVQLDSDYFTGQATHKTIKELENQYGFRPVGVGGSAMVVVQSISIDVETEKELTMDEARRIAVKSIELFQRNVNNIKQLRPFLIEYPFPTRRLEIHFLLSDPHTGEFQHANGLSVVRVVDDKVQFVLEQPTDRYCKVGNEQRQITERKIFHEESLAEAREIVHKDELLHPQPPPIPQKPSAVKSEEKKSYTHAFFSYLFNLPGAPKNPHKKKEYYGPHGHVSFSWFFDNQCQQFAKKHDLSFIRVGDFTGSITYREYGGSFVSSKQITLNEGRILGAALFEYMYPVLRDTPEAKNFRAYLCKLLESMHRPQIAPVADPKEFTFKIAFWDDNYDRIMPPHLAQILLLDGVFSYYEADPQTQALKLILKEPYKETLAFKNQLEKKTP